MFTGAVLHARAQGTNVNMPGLSFICDLKGGDLRRDQAVILGAMDSLLHYERYEKHEWLNDNVHYLGYTAYNEYPIKSFDVGDVSVFLEGRLYGGNPTVDSRTGGNASASRNLVAPDLCGRYAR
jgi:hypothetical protein